MYIILWEFLVEPEKVFAFVANYKSTGAWAKLFEQAEGYVGTQLLSSIETGENAKFITIDRWKTAEDFERFRKQFSVEYRTLDTQFESLALDERKLGTYVSDV
jgi:heme-degrading monooxygenase HmoA